MDFSIFKTYGFIIILLSISVYFVETDGGEKNNMEGNNLYSSVNINELYKIKCTDNINAPFNNYNLEQYNYDSDEYKQCTLESKINIIDSMEINENKYRHYSKSHESEINTYNYLQMLCSSEKIKPLSAYVPGNDCSKIPNMIVTATTANEKIIIYQENVTTNKESYEHMERFYESSTQRVKEIKKFIDAINHALNVCAKSVGHDVSVYNNIESTVNIREKLPEIWARYRTLNKNLKQKCDEFFDPTEYDATIEAGIDAYSDIIESLEKKQQELYTLGNNLKKILVNYNEWSMEKYYPTKLKQDFDEINIKYTQQDSAKLKIHEKTVTHWGEYVRKISTTLPKLSSSKQNQLKQALQQLTQYTSENIKITEVNSEILALLKSNDVSIQSLISEINGIEIEHKKESLSVDLTTNVLHTVNLIIHNWFHDDENKQESYNKLTQFEKSKNEYVYITDESGIDKIKSDTNEFEKKVEQTKESLLQLKIKINDFMISIDKNMENIKKNGDDLANLFNKLSPGPVDKPDNVKPPPIITTKKTDVVSPPPPPTITTKKPDVVPTPDKRTPTHEKGSSSNGKKIGLIVGISLGVLALIIIVVVIFVVIKYKNIRSFSI